MFTTNGKQNQLLFLYILFNITTIIQYTITATTVTTTTTTINNIIDNINNIMKSIMLKILIMIINEWYNHMKSRSNVIIELV